MLRAAYRQQVFIGGGGGLDKGLLRPTRHVLSSSPVPWQTSGRRRKMRAVLGKQPKVTLCSHLSVRNYIHWRRDRLNYIKAFSSLIYNACCSLECNPRVHDLPRQSTSECDGVRLVYRGSVIIRSVHLSMELKLFRSSLDHLKRFNHKYNTIYPHLTDL